jgi:8-oxo-dGTP diphosphatase
MILVVAALIQRDGRFLICQRRRDDTCGLKWEFPGGKVKLGETPEQALERELREELSAAASIGRLVYSAQHRYAGHAQEIKLLFFSASLDDAHMKNLAFEALAWEEPAALPQYDFLPADRELIELLACGGLPLH